MVSELRSLPVRPIEVTVRDAGRSLGRSRKMSCNMFGQPTSNRRPLLRLGPRRRSDVVEVSRVRRLPSRRPISLRTWMARWALVGRGTERLLRSDGDRVCWGRCTTRRERCRFVTEGTAWPLLDRRVASLEISALTTRSACSPCRRSSSRPRTSRSPRTNGRPRPPRGSCPRGDGSGPCTARPRGCGRSRRW
jgi:hypothetical protein